MFLISPLLVISPSGNQVSSQMNVSQIYEKNIDGLYKKYFKYGQ